MNFERIGKKIDENIESGKVYLKNLSSEINEDWLEAQKENLLKKNEELKNDNMEILEDFENLKHNAKKYTKVSWKCAKSFTEKFVKSTKSIVNETIDDFSTQIRNNR